MRHAEAHEVRGHEPPLFPSGGDPGPSFVELLRRSRLAGTEIPIGPGAIDAPAVAVGSQPVRLAVAPMPGVAHGTTIVALRYDDGVVMAGDRRATEGDSIAHRSIEKVFPADRTPPSPSPARRARPSRWCACSRPSSSTTRRSKASG